jgi:hypothetical protein
MLNEVAYADPSNISFDQFRKRLAVLLSNDLDLDRGKAARLSGRVADLLANGKTSDLQMANWLLAEAGVQERWNHVFRRFRASYLARWLGGHVHGSILDLLCGDGEVGRSLAAMGHSVSLVERPEAYSHVDFASLPLKFTRYADFVKRDAEKDFDTVVLSTVLHHEAAPKEVLELALRHARRRVVVVENCLDTDFTHEYHMLVDIFFNCCLNSTGLESPGQHRTCSDWARYMQTLGEVVATEVSETVPGIPLRHHLIVADVNR